MLQSKCLRLATGAPWYASNRQIHEDLGVTLFVYHIRALTASFDSKLADVWNPLYGNSADTCADRGLTPSPETKTNGGKVQQTSRGHRPRWPSRLNESRSALISRAPFGYPDWGFPWFYSVVRQIPVYTMQRRVTALIPPPGAADFLSAWKVSHTPSMRQSQSGLRTRTTNQAKFVPSTTGPRQPMRYSLVWSVKAFSLTSKTFA